MKLKLFFTLSCLLFYVVCFAQHERYTYDANGNILSMTVTGGNGPLKNLTYFYDPKHTGNRLIYVHDNLTGKDYHFAYDAIGELIKDELHGITNVIYDIRNNPTQVEKADGTILTYEYDAFSHCISSNTMKPGQPTVHEVYVLDMQGNRMSTYSFVDTTNAHLHQTEVGIFGKDQVGVYQMDVDMSKPFDPTKPTTFERGHKLYFLRNQVGTVVAIVSDEKRAIPKADNPALVDHYEAIVLSASDYSPYGAISRSYNADSMPYGFNGQLKRPEIARNHYTANFWEYDADLGRRWNLDPKGNASISPYATFNDNPIWFSDPFGDTSINIPGGGKMDIGDSKFETFSGGAQKVGNLIIYPAKGTLKSFNEYNSLEAVETSRFVATFNTRTGQFSGYLWEGNMTETYEHFEQRQKEDYIEQYENAGNPLYQHYNSPEEAKKNTLNNALALTLPNLLIRPLTIATNTAKILRPLGLGSTGRTIPANLTEQLAMEEIISHPEAGRFLIRKMTDASGRWNGWSKMSNEASIHGVEIHYNALWENGVIKSIDDFKFIDKKL